MRTLVRWLMVGVAAAQVSAQPPASQVIVCQLGPGNQFSPAYNQLPAAYAASQVQTIYTLLCPAGCGRVDLFLNQTTPNALTATSGAGYSMIAYNPGFMNGVHRGVGPGAAFGILAHEFGHHIDLNTYPLWMSDDWGRELRADAWAGCALARVGFGPDQLARALQAIAAYPSRSHPAWNLRIPAVQQGFAACGGQVHLLPWN